MGFPHGHRKITSLVAGLRMSGMTVPMLLDGPINGHYFEAYVVNRRRIGTSYQHRRAPLCG
jgi:hypothetical protein